MKLKVIAKAPFTFAQAMWHAFLFWWAGRPVLTPPKFRDARLNKCAPCENNVKGWCQLCSCYVEAKISLSSEQCPDDPPRWRALTSDEEPPLSGC